jgi:hypothetical protein
MTTDVSSTPHEAPTGEPGKPRHNIPGIAAAAHPLRRRLLDLIDVYGPATTAQLADRTGQPTHIVAPHLAILRDARWIEQMAEPTSDTDAPPWQMPAGATRIMTNDLPDDPVSKAVVLAAQSVTWERHNELIANWMLARGGPAPSPATHGYGSAPQSLANCVRSFARYWAAGLGAPSPRTTWTAAPSLSSLRRFARSPDLLREPAADPDPRHQFWRTPCET